MRDLAHPIQLVSPQERIIKVLSRFQRDRALKVLPVVEGEAIVGIVNRSTLAEEQIIGRHRFGGQINQARKIRELMEPQELSYDAATPVEEGAKVLPPLISSLRIDNICIISNGAYAGVIEVNRFIGAMTGIQIVLAKGANPLSGLPGNTSIERKTCGRLDSGAPFDIA
jgi:predicted transcriptional regulator